MITSWTKCSKSSCNCSVSDASFETPSRCGEKLGESSMTGVAATPPRPPRRRRVRRWPASGDSGESPCVGLASPTPLDSFPRRIWKALSESAPYEGAAAQLRASTPDAGTQHGVWRVGAMRVHRDRVPPAN